jgi:hypothetical protein
VQEGRRPGGKDRDDPQAELATALIKREAVEVAAPKEAGIRDPQGQVLGPVIPETRIRHLILILEEEAAE